MGIYNVHLQEFNGIKWMWMHSSYIQFLYCHIFPMCFFPYNTQVSQRIVQTWQCALLVFIQPTKLQLCGSVGDASECLHTPEMPMFELTCPNMLQWRRPPAPTHGMLYYLPAWYFMISDQPMMDFGTGTNVNI